MIECRNINAVGNFLSKLSLLDMLNKLLTLLFLSKRNKQSDNNHT